MKHFRMIGTKTTTVLLALVMTVAMMPGMTLKAWADGPLSYITHTVSGNTAAPSTETCETYTELESSSTNWESGKWYVVPEGGVTIQDRITVNGSVNLILRDGTKLTASKGINVGSGNTLTIYAQSEGSNKGELAAKNGNQLDAAIGGGEGNTGGNVIIHGGTVSATAEISAGIGGGYIDYEYDHANRDGYVIIYDGTVTAFSGDGGAGIGGGFNNTGGDITIYGGTVKATGGNFGGAGIGGGYNGSGGTIIINGGEVTAKSIDNGAGIGGGYNGSGGTITINGGNVIAKCSAEDVAGGGGSFGAGIGGGYNGAGGTITINGGVVNASGGNDGAGIGTGEEFSGDGGSVTVNSGEVIATGGKKADGIGAGENSSSTTLMLGDGMYVYGGDSPDPNTGIPPVGGDYARKRYMIVNDVPAHYHNFTYTADGAVITASCTYGCDITEGLTIEISAPDDTTYDGTEKPATINDDYNRTAFPGSYSIRYTKDGSPYEGVPAGIGAYTASVTAGGVTATVSYEIALAEVPYRYYDTEAGEFKDGICDTYTTLTEDSTEWEDGVWYVVPEDLPEERLNIQDRISVNGTVNLILRDRSLINAFSGIKVSEGNTLNIYAQSDGSSRGMLNIVGADTDKAGIGGDNNEAGGTVTIHGGYIISNGGENASGIGGGSNGAGGTVAIHDGLVRSNGGEYGAGIGGGNRAAGGEVTVNGGNIEAKGFTGAAGIGGGYRGAGGPVTINDGMVTANGSSDSSGIGKGAGGSSDDALAVGRVLYVYGGDTENPANVITATDGDYARSRYMVVTRTPPTVTVTFKVINGSWNDDTAEDKTVTLIGSNGEMPKLTENQIPEVGSKPAENHKAGSWDVTPDTAAAITEDVTYTYTYAADDPAPVPKADTSFKRLQAKSTEQVKTAVTIEWKKVSGAKSYVIYGSTSGKSSKMKKLAETSGVSKKINKIGSTRLKKGTYYKFKVVALDKNGNKITSSSVIYVATKGGKAGNYKSVTVSKTVIANAGKLKKGKTLKLNAKAVKPAGLTVKNLRGIRYESDDPAIATVSSTGGAVKAKKKGTCYIYAYAQNGVAKKIKVVVQ